jgi:chemotaxis protein CheD
MTDLEAPQRLDGAERRTGRIRPVPGTPGIDGYFDTQFQLRIFKLLPGEWFVSRRHEILTTVLGSCIAACIRDPKAGIGGMNHFMLPTNNRDSGGWGTMASTENRYGSYAMESLINGILKLGGERSRLEVKIFGGAAVIKGMSDVGGRNIEFVRNFLHTEGLRIVAENVGADTPRRVNYFPRTGEVMIKRLRSLSGQSIAIREKDYMSSLVQAPVTGSIELFD